MRLTLLLSVLALVASAPAAPATLSASGAWVRAVPGSDVAAVYFVLHNGGAQAVTLRAVGSPVAASAMVHETSVSGGQARMRPRAPLTLKAGASLTFAPEGLHVMLQQLRAPLAVGARVPVVLEFTDGERLEFSAPVRPLVP